MKCWYCGSGVRRKADREMDHWPVPDRHGGKHTVAACRTCHNLKDRIPLKRWPSYATEALEDEVAKIGKLSAWIVSTVENFPWDATVLTQESIDMPYLSDSIMTRLMKEWLTTPPLARILVSKSIALAIDFRALDFDSQDAPGESYEVF